MLAAVPLTEDVPVAADAEEAALEDTEDDELSDAWSEMTPPATSDWEEASSTFDAVSW